MARLGVSGAAAVGGALSRLSRAAPSDLVPVLPLALVGDRLEALIAEPDVDRALESVLGGVVETAAPQTGGPAAGSWSPPRPAGLATTRRQAQTPPTREDPARRPAQPEGRPRPGSATPFTPLTRATVDGSGLARVASRVRVPAGDPSVPTAGRRPTAPVDVRRDPQLRTTLRDLLSVRGPEASTWRPLRPFSVTTSPPPTPAVSPPPRPGPGPTSDLALPQAPISTAGGDPWPTPAGSGPTVSTFAVAHPEQIDPLTRERAGTLPPTGLAGLVSWWEGDTSDPAPAFATGAGPTPGPGTNVVSPRSRRPDADLWAPDEREPPRTADPLAAFRETLEQVLLDEALADGLEVRDGPA